MFSIEVTDKGIGINELDMKNLFSPFFKTSDSISREKNKQSHGLGLYISKLIAEKLQGNISVKSTSGNGSTF